MNNTLKKTVRKNLKSFDLKGVLFNKHFIELSLFQTLSGRKDYFNKELKLLGDMLRKTFKSNDNDIKIATNPDRWYVYMESIKQDKFEVISVYSWLTLSEIDKYNWTPCIDCENENLLKYKFDI